MREIVLDTETTGFEPAAGHRLVEIGCVELMHRLPTGKTFHTYLNPERSMPEGAFRVHGLSEAFLQDKPLFKTIADDFLAFIGNDPLIIHNAAFDMKFLNAELALFQKSVIPYERAIDTLLMARKKFPGSPASLDALCRRFNVNNAHREKHGALLDSEILAEVYLELTGGRQRSLDILSPCETSVAPIQGSVLTENLRTFERNQPSQTPVKTYPARTFPISPAEQAAHAAFMEKIKKAS